MPRLRAWFSRLLGLVRKSERDAEMAEEMQAHLDLLTERNVAAGMSPPDACNTALPQLCGIEQTKENAGGTRVRWTCFRELFRRAWRAADAWPRLQTGRRDRSQRVSGDGNQLPDLEGSLQK